MLGSPGPASIDDMIATVFQDHEASIQRRATRLTRDSEIAADVTQEAFLRLMIEARAGRCPTNVRAWLYRTSANLVVSQARREAVARRLAPQLLRLEMPAQPDTVAELRAEHHALEVALGTLPRTDREILIMAGQGATGRQIARHLGGSHAAARTRLSRARGRLRAVSLETELPTAVEAGARDHREPHPSSTRSTGSPC